MTDAWRLAFGTLTVLRVRPPARVDARTARTAMILAPLVGTLVGLVAAGWALALGLAFSGSSGRLVVAAASVALIAGLTRAIHLDGLADTADGLGSGRAGQSAVAVMKRPDVGPFGVVTLTLTLLLQTGALSAALSTGRGALALVGGCTVSRLALTWGCRQGVPPATPTGLGSAVASTVPMTGVLTATAAVGGVLFLLVGLGPDPRVEGWIALAALVSALVAAGLLVRRCTRRFGGVTGDVLGASCEVAFSVFLLVVAAT